MRQVVETPRCNTASRLNTMKTYVDLYKNYLITYSPHLLKLYIIGTEFRYELNRNF